MHFIKVFAMALSLTGAATALTIPIVNNESSALVARDDSPADPPVPLASKKGVGKFGKGSYWSKNLQTLEVAKGAGKTDASKPVLTEKLGQNVKKPTTA
ncbi:hypothetical protein TWF694_001957 [Orbilia ellipsospora]|uniref:Uncharacterized protein n=1 Tax=Orbilia ellipsospora TaxID=2528407 RepID=A0AAV9X473_9PEZI